MAFHEATTIAATSSNHSEILAVHEASRELFRTWGVIRVVLFFLHHGFVPLGFPGKVLMRQHLKCITIDVWLWHPRGSVINHIVDVHNRPGS
uniref:Uncharacterized protein n=1 Tax=Brassica oleracea var. oleracea TaxID=109376 RepID=A0A0D3CDF8_BRAOL